MANPIHIELGYRLVESADPETGTLADRIQAFRDRLEATFGFVLPRVRLVDDLALDPYEYTLSAGGATLARGTAENRTNRRVRRSDPAATICEHFEKVVRLHLGDFLGADEIQRLVEEVAVREPTLVAEFRANAPRLGHLTWVLRALLDEHIPLLDLATILHTYVIEELFDGAHEHALARVREALSATITAHVAPEGRLRVVTLGDDFAAQALWYCDADRATDVARADAFLTALHVAMALADRHDAWLLVPPATRGILRRHRASMSRSLLAATELGDITLDVVATAAFEGSSPARAEAA